MTEMVLLDDPRIRQVDCENRPEKMVSMRGIHKNILIDAYGKCRGGCGYEG